MKLIESDTNLYIKAYSS